MFYSKYSKLRNWTNYILYKIYKRKPYQLKDINSICELVGNGFETFFGYYDKTPFSLNNSFVLGMKLKINSLKSLKIGYFDLNKDNRVVIMSTRPGAQGRATFLKGFPFTQALDL